MQCMWLAILDTDSCVTCSTARVFMWLAVPGTDFRVTCNNTAFLSCVQLHGLAIDTHTFVWVKCMYMLPTNCKLEKFVNGPPVYKLIIQFLKWLVCFQLYEAKWSNSQTRLNSLAEQLRSWLNGLQTVHTAWKLYLLAEQTARGSNDQMIYWSIQAR